MDIVLDFRLTTKLNQILIWRKHGHRHRNLVKPSWFFLNFLVMIKNFQTIFFS